MKWPKLSAIQNKVLEHIIDGAEIQVINGVYTLCFDDGNIESVQERTFNKLKEARLIKLKYSPSIDVERWG